MGEQNVSTPEDAPAIPTEERLGRFVADALERLQRGESVVVKELLADRPAARLLKRLPASGGPFNNRARRAL